MSNFDAAAHLQEAMRHLERVFPGCAIALLVAPFEKPTGGRVNYIGNGNRDDMRVMMKEVIARWEGRHQTPAAKQ